MSRKKKSAIKVLEAFQEEGKVLSYKEYKESFKRGRVRPDRVKYIWGSWSRVVQYIRKSFPEAVSELDDELYQNSMKLKVMPDASVLAEEAAKVAEAQRKVLAAEAALKAAEKATLSADNYEEAKKAELEAEEELKAAEEAKTNPDGVEVVNSSEVEEEDDTEE